MHLILKMIHYIVVYFLSNSFTVVATHIKHDSFNHMGVKAQLQAALSV